MKARIVAAIGCGHFVHLEERTAGGEDHAATFRLLPLLHHLQAQDFGVEGAAGGEIGATDRHTMHDGIELARGAGNLTWHSCQKPSRPQPWFLLLETFPPGTVQA